MAMQHGDSTDKLFTNIACCGNTYQSALTVMSIWSDTSGKSVMKNNVTV